MDRVARRKQWNDGIKISPQINVLPIVEWKEVIDDSSLIDKLTVHFPKPNVVQAHFLAIVKISRKNILVLAPTGSGKTLNYVILTQRDKVNKRYIILEPTRELVYQVEKYFDMLGVAISLHLGGQSTMKNFDASINLGTIGSMVDDYNSGLLKVVNCSCELVIDEYDRFYEQDTVSTLEDFVTRLSPSRRFWFSATSCDTGNSRDDLITLKLRDRNGERDIKRLNLPSVSKIKQLVLVLRKHRKKRKLVFCNSRVACEELYRNLKKEFGNISLLHGGSERRQETIEEFDIHGNTLICTDLAARGCDFFNIDMLINYDKAKDEKTQMHREGRLLRHSSSTSFVVNFGS